MAVRLLPAQVQLSQDGQAHEEPVAEAVVVDEPEDVLHAQVDQRHHPLGETHTRQGEVNVWVRGGARRASYVVSIVSTARLADAGGYSR